MVKENKEQQDQEQENKYVNKQNTDKTQEDTQSQNKSQTKQGKAEEKPQNNAESSNKNKSKSSVHINTFLSSVEDEYELTGPEKAGFKMFMKGQHYKKDENEFENNLKEFLDLK